MTRIALALGLALSFGPGCEALNSSSEEGAPSADPETTSAPSGDEEAAEEVVEEADEEGGDEAAEDACGGDDDGEAAEEGAEDAAGGDEGDATEEAEEEAAAPSPRTPAGRGKLPAMPGGGGSGPTHAPPPGK